MGEEKVFDNNKKLLKKKWIHKKILSLDKERGLLT